MNVAPKATNDAMAARVSSTSSPSVRAAPIATATGHHHGEDGGQHQREVDQPGAEALPPARVDQPARRRRDARHVDRAVGALREHRAAAHVQHRRAADVVLPRLAEPVARAPHVAQQARAADQDQRRDDQRAPDHLPAQRRPQPGPRAVADPDDAEAAEAAARRAARRDQQRQHERDGEPQADDGRRASRRRRSGPRARTRHRRRSRRAPRPASSRSRRRRRAARSRRPGPGAAGSSPRTPMVDWPP